MLVKELFEKLKNIDQKLLELKQEKKDLITKAKKERVLEVQLSDLIKELKKLTKCPSLKIKVNPIYIPTTLFGKQQEAKDFLIKNNTGLGVRIEDINVYQFTISIKDTKIKNDQYLIDHLKFEKETSQMIIPEEIIPQMLINIDLNNGNMEKEFFKQAVLKCVEKREKNQSITNNI